MYEKEPIEHRTIQNINLCSSQSDDEESLSNSLEVELDSYIEKLENSNHSINIEEEERSEAYVPIEYNENVGSSDDSEGSNLQLDQSLQQGECEIEKHQIDAGINLSEDNQNNSEEGEQELLEVEIDTEETFQNIQQRTRELPNIVVPSQNDWVKFDENIQTFLQRREILLRNHEAQIKRLRNLCKIST